MQETKKRIHPLMAGAAAAVIVASGVGVAAMTGYLPGTQADTAAVAPASAGSTATTQKATPLPASPSAWTAASSRRSTSSR
jgi:hypothetical protein